MSNQWSRKSKLITAWVGLTLRLIVGLFLIGASLVFFEEMTKNAESLSAYALCAFVPIFAVVVVGGDLYLRYKLDIRPLTKMQDKNKNPLEFK